jgi:hypothetical protein
MLVLVCAPIAVSAQAPACQSRLPQLLGAQATLIAQHLVPFQPGYNRDRGPATVITLRLNARY